MTRLYYSNPYLTSWDTEIESISERAGNFIVTLKETAFYPEGGGQPSDRGRIDNIQVIDVLQEEGTVYHILSGKPKNSTVSCEIDFARRFDHMQQHTGQHLLSAVFYNLYGGETSGFHLGEEYVSIDISLRDIAEENLKKIEEITNDYIYKNLEVKNYIILPEEIEKLPLRKLPPVTESIRIVEIDKMDYSPCCGTHVTRTGELGIIKITKTEKYKGMTRVYFKCGKRALLDFMQKQDTTAYISKALSAGEAELSSRVDALTYELKNSSKLTKDLKEKLFLFEAKELIETSNSKLIVKSFNDKSFDEVQMLSKQLLLKGDFIVILSSIPDRKLSFGHSGSFSIHCGKLLKENLSRFSGRGGGGEKQSQAGFENLQDLYAFENFLKDTATHLAISSYTQITP